MAQVLLYSDGAGPRLQRCGCMVLVGTAAHERGRRALEGGPLQRAARASAMAGSVLHPQQAVTHTRGRSTRDPGSGPHGLRSGLVIFFIIEI
jgi:hypothetical protein